MVMVSLCPFERSEETFFLWPFVQNQLHLMLIKYITNKINVNP